MHQMYGVRITPQPALGKKDQTKLKVPCVMVTTKAVQCTRNCRRLDALLQILNRGEIMDIRKTTKTLPTKQLITEDRTRQSQKDASNNLWHQQLTLKMTGKKPIMNSNSLRKHW
ncbi:hypothetical protein EVAR_29786_1 [Eumeta japonica]|uniref:Uncharacterized protein n=1 Tax=Eumeta variegata TaxID=151549 RepID=A0A4C1XQ63_EUMVA|nr:hypothetical protein EVAR_29786_1 [Eumeta japonica]